MNLLSKWYNIGYEITRKYVPGNKFRPYYAKTTISIQIVDLASAALLNYTKNEENE